NAVRYLFQDEPTEVFAVSAKNGEKRFEQIDEMTSAILKFPGERLATFTSSFGAAPVSTFQIVGTQGDLRMDSAYSYLGELKQQLTINGQTQERSFPAGDQFAAEITYFSDCLLTDKAPEPSGVEGLADIRIIQAIYQSARTGQPVQLGEFKRQQRPTAAQVIQRAATQPPELIHAADPSGKS
ncbi:MAG: gfo/Idh/MocA family oxidoreductase, partial [Chroococcidiopsidaceae cyanobacterium CP_BM_RX_35]|nr:gfo/Idh/MocA family oxidoreductase [Chroococcidiopsidaceae cyanobacterium CP_BM_RX_35]